MNLTTRRILLMVICLLLLPLFLLFQVLWFIPAITVGPAVVVFAECIARLRREPYIGWIETRNFILEMSFFWIVTWWKLATLPNKGK